MYKKILLKISGESLSSTDNIIDVTKLAMYVREIKDIYHVARPAQIGIVVGGGNIYRGTRGIVDRQTGDYMGMMATNINGLALQSALEREGVKCKLMSGLPVDGLLERACGKTANEYLKQGFVVIFCGGTGNPYFTTDTAAALRAAEIHAEIILKLTKVDGVYDKDHLKEIDAVKYDALTFDEVYEKKLGVMDATAFTLCRDNSIPIIVYNGTVAGNLRKIVHDGEEVGTLISQ